MGERLRSGRVNRAVFLDRDGVLNRVVLRDRRPHAPTTPEAVEILPGVGEALSDLRAAGFILLVVTNQPDVANGSARRESVEAIHAMLLEALPLDDVLVCFHVDADGCACRKPKPGLILEGAERWGVDVARSYVVGDRWRDIAAGKAAGATTIWVEQEYAEQAAKDPDIVVRSLREASVAILAREGMPGIKQDVKG